MTTKIEPVDFYRLTEAHASKVNDVPRESAIRLYCTTSGQDWGLQVRAPMMLNSMKGEAKDFVVAHATLSVEDLKALRAAIDAVLATS